jgi:hypothetical protein
MQPHEIQKGEHYIFTPGPEDFLVHHRVLQFIATKKGKYIFRDRTGEIEDGCRSPQIITLDPNELEKKITEIEPEKMNALIITEGTAIYLKNILRQEQSRESLNGILTQRQRRLTEPKPFARFPA